MKKKVEGYWRTKQVGCELPVPISNTLSVEDSKKYYNLLIAKQERAKEERYKGFSYSRITGEQLGCVEYTLNDWTWTGDLAEHYILKHRVKPSDEFIDFLLDKRFDTLLTHLTEQFNKLNDPIKETKYRIQTITKNNGSITYSAQIETNQDIWEAILSTGRVAPGKSLDYIYWGLDNKNIAEQAIENHKKGGIEIKTIETKYL